MPPWYFWNLWQFLIGRPWAKCVTRSHQHGQNFAGPPNTLNHVPSRWLLRQWQIPFLGTIFPLLRKYSWNRFGRTSKLYMWRLDEPKLHAPWHNYGRFGYFSCSPSLLDVDFWIFSSFAVGIPKCSNIVFNFDCGCWSPALSSIFGISPSVAAHTISSKGKLMLPQLAVILSRRIIPLNRDAEKNTAFTLLHQCEFGCQSNQNIGEMNNADFLLKLTPFSNHFGVTEAGPMAGTSNNVDRRSEPGFCLALRMRGTITGLVLVPCAVKVAGIPILSPLNKNPLSLGEVDLHELCERGDAECVWILLSQAVSYRFRSSDMAC